MCDDLILGQAKCSKCGRELPMTCPVRCPVCDDPAITGGTDLHDELRRLMLDYNLAVKDNSRRAINTTAQALRRWLWDNQAAILAALSQPASADLAEIERLRKLADGKDMELQRLVDERDAATYFAQTISRVSNDCREMMKAIGFGQPGHSNTNWGMTKEVCDELVRLRQQLVNAQEGIVEVMHHRNAWRRYAYGRDVKPQDHLDGNNVNHDTEPTAIERLEKERDSVVDGVKIALDMLSDDVSADQVRYTRLHLMGTITNDEGKAMETDADRLRQRVKELEIEKEAFKLATGTPQPGETLADAVSRLSLRVVELEQQASVNGPIYNAGRSEGHADVAARLRAILDPNLNLDGLMEEVAALNRRAANITQDQANKLKDVLHTLTASGVALITSARELVAKFTESKQRVDELSLSLENVAHDNAKAYVSLAAIREVLKWGLPSYVQYAGFEANGVRAVAEWLKEQSAVRASERDRLVALVNHCYIHSGYLDCGASQMDSGMRELYEQCKREFSDGQPDAQAGGGAQP